MAAAGNIRHIANLWTLMGYPTREGEWSVETKVRAIRDAGFDGVCWAPSAELQGACQRYGLEFVGGMASGDRSAFSGLLQDLQRYGAEHVNVQLAGDETPVEEALELTLELMREGRALGLQPAIESHRGTATETPEKMYALADGYARATGELLPVSWDFSHFAVVKHLLPDDYERRLLVRPDLVQAAQQFHFRPFNGHHVQVPITDGTGQLTAEVRAWLPFAEAVLRCWWEGNRGTDRHIYLCPELGPVEGGYALSTFPDSWEQAKVLRGVIAELWAKVTA